MNALMWILVVLAVVSVQVTLLHYVAIGDIRPDLCVALTSLMGFLRGERIGLLFGMGIGFAQDLASTGEVWLNMLTQGAVGLVSGLVGRRLARTTVLFFIGLVMSLSILSGMLFFFSGRGIGSLADVGLMLRSVLLPQAAYDSVIAAGLYWLLVSRIGITGEMDNRHVGKANVLSAE